MSFIEAIFLLIIGYFIGTERARGRLVEDIAWIKEKMDEFVQH